MNYRELLDALCKHNLSYQVVNSGPEHAAQLIGAIVRHSTKKIRAFANDMNGDISNANGSTLVPDVENAINRGVEIQVMLRSVPDSSSPLIQVLRKGMIARPGQVTVCIAPDSFVTRMSKDEVPQYFTLGDDRRFRKETDPSLHVAFGNMNDPDEVSLLGSIFDSHWKDAIQVFH